TSAATSVRADQTRPNPPFPHTAGRRLLAERRHPAAVRHRTGRTRLLELTPRPDPPAQLAPRQLGDLDHAGQPRLWSFAESDEPRATRDPGRLHDRILSGHAAPRRSGRGERRLSLAPWCPCGPRILRRVRARPRA